MHVITWTKYCLIGFSSANIEFNKFSNEIAQTHKHRRGERISCIWTKNKIGEKIYTKQQICIAYIIHADLYPIHIAYADSQYIGVHLWCIKIHTWNFLHYEALLFGIVVASFDSTILLFIFLLVLFEKLIAAVIVSHHRTKMKANKIQSCAHTHTHAVHWYSHSHIHVIISNTEIQSKHRDERKIGKPIPIAFE